MQLDLDTFKQRLETERTQLQDEMNRLHDENIQLVGGDSVSHGVSNHPGEAASQVMSRERNLAVYADLEFDLRRVEHALERIEDGTYGICEVCGNPIPVERLEAQPAATLCVRDQSAREQAGA